MITAVEVRNAVGTLLVTLPVTNVNSAVPYIITNIDGLEPVKADVSYLRYAGQDGGVVQATRTGSRSLILDIGYRPNYQTNQTVQSLRQAMYGYFPIKGEVTLRLLIDDSPDMEVKGVVETVKPLIFTKDPEIQITIFCPLSYLSGLASVTLGAMNEEKIYPLTVLGTAETGFVFELTVNRTVPLVKLKNGLQPDIVYERSLIAGDKLTISTNPGNKYLRVTRAGVTTSDLDGLQNGSVLDMILDTRTVEFYANVAGAHDMPYTVTFLPKYVGV